MNIVQWAILGLLAVIWGSSFLLIEVALPSFPPITLVLLRCILASITLYAVLRSTGRRLPFTQHNWWPITIVAATNIALPFVLVTWGQIDTSAGLAAILNATTPLFGIMLGHVLTRDEKITPAKLIGVILGIIGVAVMIGPDAMTGFGGNVLAEIAILVASISYAYASIYGRRLAAMDLDPMQISAGQTIISSLLLLPLALIVDTPWHLPVPTMGAVLAVIALGLLSTTIAYILYFKLLADAGATNALLVAIMIPVPAIILGAILLGEQLSPRDYAGIILIALGLVAIDGRVFNRVRA